MGLSTWWRRAIGTPVTEAAPKVKPPKITRAGFEHGIPPAGLTEYSNWYGGTAPGRDRRTELQELYEVYEACPWAYAAVNAVARRVTAGALEFAWQPPEGDGDQEQPPKPPTVIAAERLFRFVNDRENIRQILRGVLVDLQLFGDAYIEVGWRGNVPVALWSLDCPTVTPIADDHGKITAYVQKTDYGQRAEFTPNQVIHFSLDAPRSGVFGMSPVQAALGPINRWLFAAATQMQTYRRGDPLRLHVDLPAHYDAPAMKRWVDTYLSLNVGPENQATPVVTKNGGVVKELQRGAITSGLEVMTTARDEILAALGVPPAQAGVIESGNLGGGTGESQDRTFQTQTCEPLASLVIDQLQYRLAEIGFGVPDGWHLQFAEVDYRDSQTVEAIREMRFKYGALTVNGWRAELGQPAVDGGDEALIVSSTGTPIRVRDLEVAAIAGVAKTTAGTGVKLKSLGSDDAPMELELAPEQPPPGAAGPGGFGGPGGPGGPFGGGDDEDTDWPPDDDEEPDEALATVMAAAGVTEFYNPADGTAWVWDIEEARYVRTAAGSKRYGLPIGAEIKPKRDRLGKGQRRGADYVRSALAARARRDAKKAAPPDGGYQPAKRTSLDEWKAEATAIVADARVAARDQDGDQRLAAIWRAQGFDGKPQVVSREEFNALGEGHIVVHRGIASGADNGGSRDTIQRDQKHASELAEQFRTGDEPYPGLGAFGNGTYTSTDEGSAESYARYPSGVTFRMALRPNARIIDDRELKDVAAALHNELNGDMFKAFGDPGRLAAALGYDAIATRPGVGRPGEMYYVVLNRTAVVVEDVNREVTAF